MVRFIFVCMAVVALSVITMAGQYMMDGIKGAEQSVAARNTQTQDAVAAIQPAAAPADQTANATSPEELNNIATTAGSETGNGNFGASFTNTAPAALSETTPATATEVPTAGEQDAN